MPSGKKLVKSASSSIVLPEKARNSMKRSHNFESIVPLTRSSNSKYEAVVDGVKLTVTFAEKEDSTLAPHIKSLLHAALREQIALKFRSSSQP